MGNINRRHLSSLSDGGGATWGGDRRPLFTRDAHGEVFTAALLYGPLKFALEVRHAAVG